MYKNFNKTLKTTILITLSNCRIIANPNECLTLCCPCLNDEIEIENKVKNKIEKKVENEIENKVKNEIEKKVKNEIENKVKNKIEKKSADEIEIENFLKTYNSNKNYKKDKIKSEKSLLEPTLDNYINAFKDIDNRLGDYFKKDIYKFDKKDDKDYCNSTCLFNFFKEKEIKDILQIGDYLVTFDTEKVDQSYKKFIEDLNEALRIKEDEDIKFLSKDIKNLKNEKREINTEDACLLSSDIYIYSNKDNKYIGGIGFEPLKNQNKTPLTFNIAYWLNYNYRGLGIMSVIVPTICKYFFTRIKEIKGYSISWDKENSKSAGLAKKTCNFIRTEHEEEYEIKEEDYEDEEGICIEEGIYITKKINYC